MKKTGILILVVCITFLSSCNWFAKKPQSTTSAESSATSTSKTEDTALTTSKSTGVSVTQATVASLAGAFVNKTQKTSSVQVTTKTTRRTTPVLKTTVNSRPIAEGKKLVWSDEFNGSVIDKNKWIYENGFVRNGEPQYYTSRTENARLQNGELILEAKRETYANAEYTSGSIQTKGHFSYQYGIFEVRAKMPVGTATWPAFWTMGINNRWPACGEIDIFEYYGNSPGLSIPTIHWAGAVNEHKTSSPAGYFDGEKPASDMTDNYHVYGMIWTPKTISFYVDTTICDVQDITSQYMNPEFHQPHFILLNYALQHKVLNASGANPDTTLPQNSQFKVDYVRVYEN